MTTLRILGGAAVHGLVDAARAAFEAASGDAIATRATAPATARLVAMLTDAAGAEARRRLGFA